MTKTSDRKTPTLSQNASNGRCRNSKYLDGPERGIVPDDKVSWSVEFKDYKPANYTSPKVLSKPVWADPDIEKDQKVGLKFNKVDGKTNRKSHVGEYQVVKGLPLNVTGRTGITGRGLLGKWGPNHAADPVVTRWKHDEKGEKVIDPKTKKPILQFVSIKRNDTGEWAIPGGMVEAGDSVSATLKKEFGEEALNTMKMDKKQQAEVKKQVKDLFKKGNVLYKGYVDDPRNTDNAWMETVAVNYHDHKGTFHKFKLQAGDDAGHVEWVDMDSNLKLYASHSYFVMGAAKVNDAHW